MIYNTQYYLASLPAPTCNVQFYGVGGEYVICDIMGSAYLSPYQIHNITGWAQDM